MIPYPQPDDVPFAPLPCSTKTLMAAAPDGSKIVLLRVTTPQGPSTFGLSAEHAKQLGEQLVQTAAQASTPGLVVAQPGEAKQALAQIAKGMNNRFNGHMNGGQW